jgi:hypothetical protein
MDNELVEVYAGWCISIHHDDQQNQVQDVDVFDTLDEALEYIRNGCG